MNSYAIGSPLVSEDLFNILRRAFIIPTNIVFACFGIINNLANIIIFTKMTPMDTMTISFTALAVSDLFYSCLSVPSLIVNALMQSGIRSLYNVDLRSLVFVLFLYQIPLFHKISIAITTFMSCERSLCVVKPFLVKQIFTKRRVVIILIAIYVSLTALFMPVFTTAKLVWRKPFNRTTRTLRLHALPGRFTAENVVQLSVGFPLVLATEVIISIAAVLMATGLRRHQQFRQDVASSITKSGRGKEKPALQTDPSQATPTSTESNPGEDQTRTPASTPAESASSKEQRLIKTVFIVAVTHVVTNSPQLIYYVVYYLEPEFQIAKRYNNIYILSGGLINLLNSLNGMVNIFVYLSLNMKYKMLFKKLFCRM
ncbi:chemosensory receptor c [Plakobranchus ocellatus]|uniref:Chemosensory receptor c n=1 Tax=Plakobranchus ocellatus TaxID=259542 RepID=A0AAV3YQF4_9GAST|nr:chemosensory receptor c [Plakobranchus ocellatus]